MEQQVKEEIYKGIVYTYPDLPKDKDVDNYKVKKHLQKWKRVELPEYWDSLSPSEQEVFINKIDDYCTFGYTFFNNGVKTYITGDHFHYLNEFQLDVGYPDYRDSDRRWFYHWEICDKDPDCFGQDYGKKRRDGYSYRALSNILNHARRTFNANYGIMSKTGSDAKECFLKLKFALEKYRDFLKPQEKTSSETKIVFDKPVQRITSKTLKQERKIALNTTISWRNTRENSFDSMAVKRILCDEPGKWEEANVEVWWSKARKFLSKGARITGKCMFGSSVNEQGKGGAKFKKIWELSDFTQKTENGRTVSGLYRYFTPAYDGFEGHIDEYGMSVIETPEKPVMGIDGEWITKGAKPYLEDERKAYKDAGDMVGYYEHRREYPFNEDDMFINPANELMSWDIAKVYQQIEYNDIHGIEDTLEYGYFQWIGGIRDNPNGVEWIKTKWDDPMCKWSFAWFPPKEECNQWIIKNGAKSPSNTHKGLFSLDPYSAVNVRADGKPSKAASHGVKKADSMHTIKHKHYISEYWNRLKDPLLVYEDMIMQCIYFGWALLPERNVRNCNDYFRNRDLHNYLLPAPSMTNDAFIEDSEKNVDAGLANADGKTRQQLTEYQSSWITNHCGQNEKTGEMGFMPFNNTLKDWLVFDVTKWTPFDLSVSSMIGCLGADAVIEIKKPQAQPSTFFPVVGTINRNNKPTHNGRIIEAN